MARYTCRPGQYVGKDGQYIAQESEDKEEIPIVCTSASLATLLVIVTPLSSASCGT